MEGREDRLTPGRPENARVANGVGFGGTVRAVAGSGLRVWRGTIMTSPGETDTTGKTTTTSTA